MEEEKVNHNAPAHGYSREFEEIELPYEGVEDRNTGLGRRLETTAPGTTISSDVSGGDLDVNLYQAEVSGEEAVGGTTPTPEQNVTEDLEKAVGLEMDDRSFLRTNDILEQRDDQRWELDPMSSEDYEEHGA
jgi:hypothetical protein